MAKNQPPHNPGSDTEYVSLYLDQSQKPEASKGVLTPNELNKLDRVLEMSGVYDIFSEVSKKWSPQLDKLQLPEDSEAREAAHTLALFYIGKEMESFNLDEVRFDEESGRLQKMDMTEWIIADALEQITDVVGKKEAQQLYKRLQTLTADALKKHG